MLRHRLLSAGTGCPSAATAALSSSQWRRCCSCTCLQLHLRILFSSASTICCVASYYITCHFWSLLLRLRQERFPICVVCFFGTAHKRPWRSKSKEIHPIRNKSDNYPGAKASLDHLVSAQPGIIPQISGKPTGLQVNGATIFVDHNSDHVYVFLMRDLTPDETILAKHAYEWFLSSIGVTSKAYHADNGRFADGISWRLHYL